ncbi:TPA: restriction endonuclease subunit S [Neisseria meningitidis]|uniref:restriction endonuclease subunit S n=1 Tax=Neisseria meningitidis TaxID=487 RepID=UPI00027CB729|nr:restriction endonuclease subunit S [Neisseria meningitidis]EJU65941.1 type I restriction enzyme [Neisseria meningitidis 69166]ELK65444.1 type I restriction modification DNA specificity domain protein [Neisseria meningitidis 68094]ELK67208.1 type I restriction modification DNA specificity domain protein [Neisseria meningitidis 88050]ELK72417.1 type I restriction modification DNA specificity domain protein [Neisseria meningitidis 70012]ELK73108.1 type I restriction modification DNA specificit
MDMQSKAKKLIEMIQTAPVEWKPLGGENGIAIIKTGQAVSKQKISNNIGSYPVINSGKEPLGYIDEWNTENDPIGITTRGAGVGSITWQEGRYFRGNLNYAVTIKNRTELDVRFLYHILLEFEQEIHALCTFTGIPALNASNLKKLLIPIPPLETQQKIVKILDKFTELEAELALRKRQYRYYRDFLLDFDNQIGGGIADGYKGRLKDVVWKTLGEVFDLKNGYTPSKSNKEYWENGSIPWFRMEDIRENSRILDNSLKHISKSAVKGGKLFPAKSIMMSTTATIGEHALIKVNYISNQQLTNFTIKDEFKDALDINFAFYYFFIIAEQSKKLINTSSLPIISMKELKKLKIPIPPLPEQEKIAAILDKFDTLTHSISEGLPHEIALRRKQYEYYREQLLAFPKAT